MDLCSSLPKAAETPANAALPGVESVETTDAAMPRPNLISLFDSFLSHGKNVAVIERRGYRRETLTYAELHRAGLFWRDVLARRGIEPGDRVLLWGPNSGAWIASFWGILLRGAIAVPMDAAASLDFVQRTTASAGVKLILRDAAQPELLGGPPSVVYNESRRADGAVTPPGPQENVDRPPERTTIAEILFTSGTTSEPRGVVLTHGNFLANLEPLERGIDAYRNYERWFHPLRFVNLVPLGHVFGQFMTLFVPPLLGAAVVFESSLHSAEIMRTIKRERATALIAVPRLLAALRSGVERDVDARKQTPWFRRAYAEADGEKFLRRIWRFRRIHRRFGWKFWAFISGGAALPAETEDFFKRIGYAVVQGYGMTETASLISLNHPFRATQGSVGKVLPGREFKLDKDGEILVRGENVSAGYWEAGELRQSSERGWLHTGDVGEVDAHGNLRFRGRKKNVIVTPAGLNVYPEDLEEVFCKQPGVRDCVVLARERDGNAEPCAVLLVEDPASETAEAAVEAANKAQAEYQRVGEWLIWPEADFPRTATGKPKLAEIRARAEAIWDAASDVPSAGQNNPAPAGGAALDELLAQICKGRADGWHRQQKLGLSSLDRVELLCVLEEKFHVELNETAFAEAQTVADLQRLLRQPSVQRSEYAYPRWAQNTLARWVRLLVYYALVWPATQILGHPRILGREHLRGLRGPVLVVSNHITRRADIGLILTALPRRFRHRLAVAMGGETLEEMREPPRDWFFLKRWSYGLGYWLVTALFNVFPLPQFSGFRESFRFAGESVDRGYSVLIFPEGVVNDTTTGEMARFQSGIGLLAQNLRIPIVPMRLDGVWRMKRERRRLAHFGEITVNIGAPVSFPAATVPAEIAALLETLIKSL
jgi:long-chain acyl-CoA synthetase